MRRRLDCRGGHPAALRLIQKIAAGPAAACAHVPYIFYING